MRDRDDVVLVVDDDECCREVIRAVLEEQLGISAFLARNGKEALQRVEMVRPVLVLLDMMMPELNGMEVARRLKENPATAAIPVIGVSAMKVRPEAIRRWIRAGKLTAIMPGGQKTGYRIRETDIERFLTEREKAS